MFRNRLLLFFFYLYFFAGFLLWGRNLLYLFLNVQPLVYCLAHSKGPVNDGRINNYYLREQTSLSLLKNHFCSGLVYQVLNHSFILSTFFEN